jgi:D-lactate dehydrogenase (cytochrome)
MTVEAGCTLTEAQNAAHEHKRLFPLSLASEGNCTIGGNLSTNAGGTAVLRYGNIRDLCLGLECVTSQGEIWNGLHNLRKDNTGYSLRNLFIGAEGTLGIITAATLKLYPLPAHQTTFLCAVSDIEQALDLFHFLQAQYDHHITSFECISDTALTLVNTYFPQFQRPFKTHSPYYLLIEISHSLFESSYELTLETILANALAKHMLIDAIIAKSFTESQNLWALREHISSAQAKQGVNIKHDISLPLASIPDFLKAAYIQLQTHFPDCQPIIFGHLGDGNLHYNISAPNNILPSEFIKSEEKINQIVYDLVHHYRGSIAAEHGIGTLKNKLLTYYKSTTELTLMRTIKNALDPHNLMNPGKLLPPDNENRS